MIAWWRTRKRLRNLEAALPDPARLEERLANLEQLADYSASQMQRLVESQDTLARMIETVRPQSNLPRS